ncbi:uncharacterized protein LOC112054974 [Bicyclus anynana]|uniref:Uncharacterized protein LOC112054974 n=1 Tax=Bicyclus anynana TaxID=110368 RepID=A0A6J1NVF9_BICAN|nr:uncharacterized protein LOC112054974 [Bicyclus anynana]
MEWKSWLKICKFIISMYIFISYFRSIGKDECFVCGCLINFKYNPKMRCDIPVLLRCCFCFPLRYGLLVLAYMKQIFSLLFFAFIIKGLCDLQFRLEGFSCMEYSIYLVVTTLDMAFHVLFIISAHTKDYRKMRVFYMYNIILLGFNVALIGLFTTKVFCTYVIDYVENKNWSIIVPALLITVILLLSQGYLILLVRSEFLKLKNNSHFEFVNKAADERCTGNLDFDKDILV